LITESPKELVKQFFCNNAKSYEKVVNLTTFGRDVHWKKEIIKRIPRCNSILDLACGTGILTFQIAEKFPDSKITGVDLTEGYLEIAKDKLKSCHKISFLLYDAEKIALDDTFDCITLSYLPKYCNPQILIERCLCHLNEGSKIILHDFVYPKNKVIRPMWNLYFVILNIIGLFTPNWKVTFKNLPKLIRSVNWVDKYKDSMERKGMIVEVSYLTLGCSAILTGTKKV
jgi:demethylmenaquinone methyltransferase/2-methoxy-6-polyprenyl-1,4-benzoquinol methylase